MAVAVLAVLLLGLGPTAAGDAEPTASARGLMGVAVLTAAVDEEEGVVGHRITQSITITSQSTRLSATARPKARANLP